MASHAPSQRAPHPSSRSSPQSSSPLESPSSAESPNQPSSSHSEPILLNPRSGSEEQDHDASSQGAAAIAQASPPHDDSDDIKRCWICFSDENEDTPLSSSWRTPCPCALTAHEACILDWVADIEGSNHGRRKQILCPQCKSQIIIARPRSLLVDIVKGLEAAVTRMVLPAIIFIGSTTVAYLSVSYGAVAVHLVLGPDDFYRIFGSDDHSPAQFVTRLAGLSIIPWMLIFSRGSVADSILPIIPMIFFVAQPRPDPLHDFSTWPPSAGLSFALLPYARALYKTYFDFVWGDKVRRWADEVKPRGGADGQRAGEVALEIGLDEEEVMEDGDDDNADANDIPDELLGPQAPPLHAPPIDQDGHAPPENGNVAAGADMRALVGQGDQHRRREINISISNLTQTVLGALVFPGVSAIAGDLLRLVLPSTWTTPSSLGLSTTLHQGRAKPTRFLQTRWGRSIVGGCLFVVLKDAVMLYVRWKMAQNHRKRRVVDYDKSKARNRVR